MVITVYLQKLVHYSSKLLLHLDYIIAKLQYTMLYKWILVILAINGCFPCFFLEKKIRETLKKLANINFFQAGTFEVLVNQPVQK